MLVWLLASATTSGPRGELWLADANFHRVRRVDADGIVDTVVGTGRPGDGPEGPALEAALYHPTDLVFHPRRPDELWLTSTTGRIEVFDRSTGNLRFAAGTGLRGYDGEGPAASRMLSYPSHLAFDGDDLYFVDQGNALVRVLRDGELLDVAGTPETIGYEGDGGPALEAQLGCSSLQVWGIAIRGRELFVADVANHVIRVVDLDSGLIDTWAGDDAEAVTFDAPTDLAVGPAGALYVVDGRASCVRRLALDGEISTFAGICGEEGAYGGDGGPATEARLNQPWGVDVGPDGTVWIADASNHVIRVVRP